MESNERDLERISELRQRLRQQVSAGEQPGPEMVQELRVLVETTGTVEELSEESVD